MAEVTGTALVMGHATGLTRGVAFAVLSVFFLSVCLDFFCFWGECFVGLGVWFLLFGG